MPALRGFRRPRLWWRTWCVLLLLTVIVCLLPMPRLPVDVQHGDKLEHFVGYALLAAYAVMLFETASARRRAALALFGLGVAIEGLQTLVPWRSGGDVADMAANAAGVGLGMLTALTPLRHALQWLDRRLA